MSGTLQLGYDYGNDVVKAVKVDDTGALHVITENADSMLIKGVETGTTTLVMRCFRSFNYSKKQ